MPPKQERILKTIDELQGYLIKLTDAKRHSRDQFKKNWSIYFSVERLIQLSVECIIEIGEHLIIISKFKKPQTYRETFDILIKQGVVSDKLGKDLQNLVDFRNKLVHAYSTVSLDRIYKIYTEEISGISEFIKIVKKVLVK